MKIAMLFGGQGGEPPRAALELAERSETARRLLDRASAASGVDVPRLLARGGGELRRTEVVQPMLTAVHLATYSLLSEAGLTPDVVAGHSLGEIAAWAAAGCVTAEDAVDVSAVRGRLMGVAAGERGGMLAVSTEDAVRDAVARGAELAAHNAPDEWVVTGDDSILDAVAAQHGGVRLPVAGPWHSRAMAGAVDELQCALEAVPSASPRCSIVCNRTGEAVDDPRDMPALLAGQLTHPIRWVAALRTLAAARVDVFVIVGPGRALRAFARKTLGCATNVLTTESPDDLRRTVERLRP